MTSKDKLTEILKTLPKLDEWDAKDQIANILGWPPVEENTYPRRAIYVDFLYQLLQHAVTHGFPLCALPYLFQLGTELLDETRRPETTRPHAEHQLRRRLEAMLTEPSLLDMASITPHMVTALLEFFQSSLLEQFSLYRYCFRNERETRVGNLTREVVVPPLPSAPPPARPKAAAEGVVEDGEASAAGGEEWKEKYPELRLAAAKELRLWKYEEDVRQIEKRAEQKLDDLRARFEALVSEKILEVEQHVLAAAIQVPNAPMDKEGTKALIARLTRLYTEQATISLRKELATLEEELNSMIDRTGLPRPVELGAPPRFKPKSATAAPSLTLGKTATVSLTGEGERSKSRSGKSPTSAAGGGRSSKSPSVNPNRESTGAGRPNSKTPTGTRSPPKSSVKG